MLRSTDSACPFFVRRVRERTGLCVTWVLTLVLHSFDEIEQGYNLVERIEDVFAAAWCLRFEISELEALPDVRCPFSVDFG